MVPQTEGRSELRERIRELLAEALSLRDRFEEPELKRQVTNIAVDLELYERLVRGRDDLFKLLVDQKDSEIATLTLLYAAYPPHGPRLY